MKIRALHSLQTRQMASSLSQQTRVKPGEKVFVTNTNMIIPGKTQVTPTTGLTKGKNMSLSHLNNKGTEYVKSGGGSIAIDKLTDGKTWIIAPKSWYNKD